MRGRATWLVALLAVACDSSGEPPATASSLGAAGKGGSDTTATSGAGEAKGTGGNGTSAPAISYTTNFDFTESPISDGGKWTHKGQDWSLVATSGGTAYGTQALSPRTGAAVYNDSYAYLGGFPPDQSVTATIHLISGIDGSTTHEVEILLRWADSAHDARGYECNLAYNGRYAEIVRWNGPLGNYTYVTAQGSGGPGAVHDGDVFSAQIVGTTITTYLNGKELATANDATFATGNPGMGFFRGTNGAGSLGDYGFTSYTAKSIAR